MTFVLCLLIVWFHRVEPMPEKFDDFEYIETCAGFDCLHDRLISVNINL